MAALVAAVGCLLAATCGPAVADESAWPTAQAKAYNFDFVPYLDPPAHPAAICLVDSGVNVTPDTPADSPDGPIIRRTSLDGGSGEGGADPAHMHGTYMAMAAGAPLNNWGTVGLWAGLRIYSIRAMPQDATSFPFDAYRRSMTACVAAATRLPMAVVNLSLGCNCDASPDARERLIDQIGVTHRAGLNVIASAGNNRGPVALPAAEPTVFAVGAGDVADELMCSFSNRGPDLDLAGPGCGMDTADPSTGQPADAWLGGTSAAAAQASAVFALLRSYRPNLTWQQAEQIVRDAALPTADGARLDVERVFRHADLGALVDAARTRMPSQPSPPTGDDATVATGSSRLVDTGALDGVWLDDSASPVTQYPSPRIARLSRARRQIVVAVTNRPFRATFALALERVRGEFGYTTVARVRGATSRLRIRIPPALRAARLRLRLTYEPRDGAGPSSPSVYKRLPE